MKCLYIDFEYNSSNEQIQNLVSCSFKVGREIFNYWLYNCPKEWERLKKDLLSYKETHAIVCFNALAEGRSFLSLGINPRNFKWIDLWIEYKMLLNHNKDFCTGPHLVDGKVKNLQPYRIHKYMAKNKEGGWIERSKSKPKNSLASCCFKLLGLKIDTERKDLMRDIIISNDAERIEAHKEEILEYGESDVEPLQHILKEVIKFHSNNKLNRGRDILKDMFLRGRNSMNASVIEYFGYPAEVQRIKNFMGNIPEMMKELQEDINSQFDWPIFRWKKPVKHRDGTVTPGTYVQNQKGWKEFIFNNSAFVDQWMLTDKGYEAKKKDFKYKVKADHLSLSFDAFAQYKSGNQEDGNFFDQCYRYLKFKRSLNGFKITPNKDQTILDSIGEDGRVRPFLNPYGSQSARFQPKALSYIPLKSKWCRSLILSDPGSVILGIDYSSQEFLISALESGDRKMIDAYHSGDVYLYTAKLCGAVPMDGKREDYEEMRNIFKAVTLGISYKMSKYGLATQLSNALKRQVSHAEAQKYIDDFFRTYKDFKKYCDFIEMKYKSSKGLILNDGWTLYGDNPNFRSSGNFPIQGKGAVILKKAIDLSLDMAFELDNAIPILPLHDALYFEIEVDDEFQDNIIDCNEIMRHAFISSFDKKLKKDAEKIRTDLNLWGPGVKKEILKIDDLEVSCQPRYLESKAEKDYKFFSKYL